MTTIPIFENRQLQNSRTKWCRRYIDFKMELMNPVRRGICEMKGTIFVGDKTVAEADLVAQIVKKPKVKV